MDDEEYNCDLHVACRIGDMDQVRFLVEVYKQDINETDKYNSPPLYYASLCGHTNVCQYLLENGAKCSEDAQDGARIYYAALTDELRNMLQSYHLTRASLDPFFEILRKAFDNKDFSDLKVIMNKPSSSSECFYLHSALVSVRCPVLANLALDPDKDGGGGSGEKQVVLPFKHALDVSVAGIMEYLYTGRFETRREDVARNALGIALELGLTLLERDLTINLFTANKDPSRHKVLVEHQDQLKQDMAKLARCVAYPRGNQKQHGGVVPPQLEHIVQTSTDVTLRVDTGETFAVHRFLLCAHSDYFRGALLGSFSEAEKDCILLSGISVEAMAFTVEWMYADQWEEEAPPQPHLCIELLDIASRLMIPRMATLASAVIAPHIDEGNVFGLFSLSRLHRLDKLEESCVRVLALRIENILELKNGDGRAMICRIIREEVAETTQQGNVDVTDVPLVADMRKMIKDHYQYLGDDEDDDNVIMSGEATMIEETKEGAADNKYGRSLRQERGDKLALLEQILQQALNG